MQSYIQSSSQIPRFFLSEEIDIRFSRYDVAIAASIRCATKLYDRRAFYPPQKSDVVS